MALLPDTPDSQLLREYIQSPDGGEILNIEPHLLPGQFCARLQNGDITVSGAHRRAQGAALHPSLAGLAAVEGLVPFNAAGTHTTDWLLVPTSSVLFGTSRNGAWTAHSGVSIPHATICSGVNHYGQLFLSTYSPTTDCAVLRIASAQDASFPGCTEFSNTGSATNFSCRGLLAAYNKLWSLRRDAIAWDRAQGSTPYNWGSSTTIHNRLTFRDGDPLIALIPVRGDTPRLLIARQRSFYLLDLYWKDDGYQATDSETLDFVNGAMVRPIVEQVGLVAPLGITWVPGGANPAWGSGDYLFLSKDGIRSLARSLSDQQGGAGLPLSHSIQSVINRINWSYAWKTTAVYHDGLVYFSFPIDGSQISNFTVTYDVQRNGWVERPQYPFAGYAVMNWNNYPELYAVTSTSVTDTYTTDVYAAHVYKLNSGFKAPGGGPLPYVQETRTLTFPMEDQPAAGLVTKKRWDWTHLRFQTGATHATLALYYKLDDASSWTLLKSLYLPANATETIYHAIGLRTLPPRVKLQYKLEDTCSYADWKLLEWLTLAYPIEMTFRG